MPIYLQDVEDRRTGYQLTPEQLEHEQFPANFPVDRWSYQAQLYLDYWKYYTGQVWEEPTGAKTKDGQPVYKFPLKINIFKTVCEKHSYALFGEVPDTALPLAPIAIIPKRVPGVEEVSETETRQAKELETFINQVWMENNGRALMQEGGLMQQFLGGIVYRVAWQPDDEDLDSKIRIDLITPDFFLPVWATGKPNDLLEAWVVWRVPSREAQLRYGYVDVNDGHSNPLYVEHWTKDSISIWLGGKPLTYTYRTEDDQQVDFTYDNEVNPFGFVPFVYIPRERAGGYYGISLIEGIVGLGKEYNARMADLGDVVRESSHRDRYVRNVTTQPKTMDLGGIRTAINLGQSPPGVNDKPDVFVVDPPQLANGVAEYPSMIYDQVRRDTGLPPVADGEDEGSQRSALTLALRMWPMTSKVGAVRTYWHVGLCAIGKMIAKIAKIKGIGGITEAHLKDKSYNVKWAPMIPRDRESELNEVVLSSQAHMLSPLGGMEALGRVEDPAREYERVQEHVEWLAKMQMLAKPQAGASSGQAKTGSEPVATAMPKGDRE